MFVIRLIAETSFHYLISADDASQAPYFVTSWALVGNKVQTYAKESSARLVFDHMREKKGALRFRHWDDSEAAIGGSGYTGIPWPIRSYEVQLYDALNQRIPARFSGPR
jgi:hypothetical protein